MPQRDDIQPRGAGLRLVVQRGLQVQRMIDLNVVSTGDWRVPLSRAGPGPGRGPLGEDGPACPGQVLEMPRRPRALLAARLAAIVKTSNAARLDGARPDSAEHRARGNEPRGDVEATTPSEK